MRHSLYVVLLTAALLLASVFTVHANSAPRITSDELKARLGEAGLVVLDVRSGGDWARAAEKIVGAQRVNPGAVGQWAGNFARDQVLVFYCT